MNSMANSKWSEQKEVYIKSKTKSCLPRRQTSEIEIRIWSETLLKSLTNQSKKIINGQLGQFMKENLDTVLKKN